MMQLYARSRGGGWGGGMGLRVGLRRWKGRAENVRWRRREREISHVHGGHGAPPPLPPHLPSLPPAFPLPAFSPLSSPGFWEGRAGLG